MWAAVWSAIGATVGASLWIAGESSHGLEGPGWIAYFGGAGAILGVGAGLGLAAVMAVSARRKWLGSLNLWLLGAWGALAAWVAARLLLLSAGAALVCAVVGFALAVGMLALAQRTLEPEERDAHGS